MYAIVEIAGKQFKINKDQYIYTHRLNQERGDTIWFDKVLLLQDKESIQIGSPALKGVKIQAKIMEHVKGDKVIVFKKKRRKGYQKKQGHRQDYTKVFIENILH